MKRIRNILMSIFVLAAVVLVGGLFADNAQAAKVGFSVSPMKQNIVLNPGDAYRGTFTISNPATSESDFSYKIEIQPYYVSEEKYVATFNQPSDRNLITDWVTILNDTTGVLSPNESVEIEFVINVPEDAPAGGQYAALTVSSDESNDVYEGGTGIQEQIAIAHTIYAEIAGNTVRQGKILEVSAPSFVFSGNIGISSQIRNDGNVHGEAKYVLQVFPLFSDEEVYSNEEKPETHTILPDRTYYNTTYWTNTPAIGIYNIVYTVEFEGMKTEVKKMVIKCPIWLLFLVIFAVIALIIYIVMKIKGRKK